MLPYGCFTFLRSVSLSAISAGIVLRFKQHKRQKEGTVPPFCNALRYVLQPYGTYYFITEKDANKTDFSHMSKNCLGNMPNLYEKKRFDATE